jgi:WD40 repeat protein
LYRQYLGRELARSRETWEERYRPLLGALAVARGAGLSRTHLAGTVALPASRVDDALLRLRQYITGPSPDGPFRLYHQSFRDFLLKDQAYHVYADEASAAIAAFLLRRHAANWLDCHDDYALENVAGHLIDAVRFDAAAGSAPGELDRLRGLMTDLTYVAARARRFGAASAEADVGQTEKLVPGDMALPTLRRQLAQVGPLLDRAPTAPDVAATLLTRLSHLPALQRSVDDLARTLPMPHLRARTPLPDSGHPALVRALELVSEPAGCAIAADGTLIVWLQDQIQVWDTTTGTQLRHFSLRPDVGALSADATTGAFVFGAERRLEIWDCLTGTRRRTIELTDAIAACCTSADGRFVVTAGRSGAVDVWDARTGVRLRTATATPPIVTCGVSGDAAVVVCHRGRTSHLPRGEAEWEDVFPEGPLELVSSGSDRELPAALARATADSFSISADGTTLLVALKPDESDGSDNADEPDDVETASTARFSVFDLDSGQETVITAHETVGWSGCLVSHDGSVAVTLDSYDALSAWHRDAGEIAVFKETHPTAARLLALSPRGELAVSAVGEEISVWDTRMRGTRTSPEGRTAWTVSPFCGGSRLLCPFYEGVVEVWETENGTAVDRLPATESSLTGGVASEDGAIAVIAEGVNFDGTPPVKVWNLPARRVEQVVLGAEAFGGELAMSRDGELVLMTREHEGRKLAAIWRTGIGAFDPTLLPDAQAGSAYALSREGGVAAIGFDDGTVELWHGLATRVRCAAAPAQRGMHAEFGVADRRLVTSAADGTVRIWDQQGRQEHCLVHGGDGAWLRGCTLSPDGRHAASVDASGCLKLWRLSDQACVLTQYFYGVLFECVWYRARELVLAGTGGVYLMSVLLDV